MPVKRPESSLLLLQAFALVRQQAMGWAQGAGQGLQPPLLLGFGGVLALIVFSGVLGGADAALVPQVLATLFWLLLFVVSAQLAAQVWREDAADGTLDQVLVRAQGSYLPLILGSFISQVALLWVPLCLVFAALWGLALGLAVPWLALFGLTLPMVALRLLASALALGAGGGSGGQFGAGSLLFLSLASPFFFMAVAGRADLIWALGLLFGPLCLLFLPFVLSLSLHNR